MYQKISRCGKKINGCDVYIGDNKRGGGWNLKASKWVAPPNITSLPQEDMYAAYEKKLFEEHLVEDIFELSHQKLGCWCQKEEQCHATVLINLLEAYEKQESLDNQENAPTIQFERIPIFRAKQVPSLPIQKRTIAIVRSRQPRIYTREKIKAEVERVRKLVAEGKLKEGQTPIDLLNINWEKDRLPVACIPIEFIMTNPVKCDVKQQNRDHIEKMWLIEQQEQASITSPIHVELTPNSIARLRSTQEIDWTPFVCKIHKVIFNKRNNRFSLQITDSPKLPDIKRIYKVELGSQLFPLIKSRFIGKGDFVKISNYVISTIRHVVCIDDDMISKPTKAKKVVVVYTIQKYV